MKCYDVNFSQTRTKTENTKPNNGNNANQCRRRQSLASTYQQNEVVFVFCHSSRQSPRSSFTSCLNNFSLCSLPFPFPPLPQGREKPHGLRMGVKETWRMVMRKDNEPLPPNQDMDRFRKHNATSNPEETRHHRTQVLFLNPTCRKGRGGPHTPSYGLRTEETPPKYVFDVTSVGARSSPWPRQLSERQDKTFFIPSASSIFLVHNHAAANAMNSLIRKHRG